MDVYGLTGGIGSGKSTVANLLEEYGVPVVSADELSRIVVAKGSPGLADVVARFGPSVVDDNGELNRRRMSGIVFQDPARRRELEEILHPRIRERFTQVLDAVEKAGHTVAVYEVPLLFEKNLHSDMKAVILVTAPEAIRIARVQKRDDVTQTEVRARIAAQMDEALKRRRADYVIENDGTLDELRREVEFLLARFLRVDRGGRRPRDESSAGPRTEVAIGPPGAKTPFTGRAAAASPPPVPDPGSGSRPVPLSQRPARTMPTPVVAATRPRSAPPATAPAPQITEDDGPKRASTRAGSTVRVPPVPTPTAPGLSIEDSVHEPVPSPPKKR